MLCRSFVWALCIGLLMGLSAPSSAMAGSKAKRIKIVAMMKAMNIMDTIDVMMPQMSEAFLQVFRKQGMDISPQAAQTISDATSKVMRANLRPYLTELVDIYDRAYSDKEIDDLVAFYKSPTGQKSLKLVPQVTQESMAAGARWGEALGPKIQVEIKRVLADQAPQ